MIFCPKCKSFELVRSAWVQDAKDNLSADRPNYLFAPSAFQMNFGCKVVYQQLCEVVCTWNLVCAAITELPHSTIFHFVHHSGSPNAGPSNASRAECYQDLGSCSATDSYVCLSCQISISTLSCCLSYSPEHTNSNDSHASASAHRCLKSHFQKR